MAVTAFINKTDQGIGARRLQGCHTQNPTDRRGAEISGGDRLGVQQSLDLQ